MGYARANMYCFCFPKKSFTDKEMYDLLHSVVSLGSLVVLPTQTENIILYLDMFLSNSHKIRRCHEVLR